MFTLLCLCFSFTSGRLLVILWLWTKSLCWNSFERFVFVFVLLNAFGFLLYITYTLASNVKTFNEVCRFVCLSPFVFYNFQHNIQKCINKNENKKLSIFSKKLIFNKRKSGYMKIKKGLLFTVCVCVFLGWKIIGSYLTVFFSVCRLIIHAHLIYTFEHKWKICR